MRNDEVRVAKLPVERRCRQHDAGQPGDQELKEERDAKPHRYGEGNLSAPHRAEPVEDLDSGGDANRHCGCREEGVRVRRHPDREQMVSPHSQAEKPDRERGGNHDRIAEDWFP